MTVRHLKLPDAGHLEGAADALPRWITYGSSITHCRTAASPAATWPALVARARGLKLTALGFRGQAHADPMIARRTLGEPQQ